MWKMWITIVENQRELSGFSSFLHSYPQSFSHFSHLKRGKAEKSPICASCTTMSVFAIKMVKKGRENPEKTEKIFSAFGKESPFSRLEKQRERKGLFPVSERSAALSLFRGFGLSAFGRGRFFLGQGRAFFSWKTGGFLGGRGALFLGLPWKRRLFFAARLFLWNVLSTKGGFFSLPVFERGALSAFLAAD